MLFRSIADSTALNLSIARDGNLKASLTSGRIAFKDKYLKGIDLKLGNPDGNIEGTLKADEMKFAPMLVKSGKVNVYAKKDSIGARFSYDNATELQNRGDLILRGRIYRDDNDSLAISTNFDPSYIYLKSRLWKITSSKMDFYSGGAQIGNLRLTGDDQEIRLNGGYSATESDTLRLNMEKFDISMANAFSNQKLGLEGRMTGQAMLISRTDDQAEVLMRFQSDSTMFGGHRAGTVKVACVWDDEGKKFNFLCRNSLDEIGRASCRERV